MNRITKQQAAAAKPAGPYEPMITPFFPAGSERPPLKVYALGGLEEIGRNCTVFECGDDIVIIDMGMMFPIEAMPGIDYIIPNISSLKGKEKNIRGVIITHGHLDHIGGLPLTIGRLGWPTIFTAPLTSGLIKKRQEEFGGVENLKFQIVDKNETTIHLGKNFVFEPFHVNHNISDAFGAALHTPHGTLIGTGDFKFDFSPVNDEPADLSHIAMFGIKGTLLLMSDSTNAESPGHQISEKQVGLELEKIVANVKGRLIVSMFSSHLNRLQQLLVIAEKYGKKVMVVGRSMNNYIEVAHEYGFMNYNAGTIIEEHEARNVPKDKLIIMCTGSQGEKNAVLMRAANREHRFLQFEPGDNIVFSSSVIPGNERSVDMLKDALVKQGCRVFHYQNMDIHAGGHAKQEDLKLMMRLLKPRFFMPIHGNPFKLVAHAALAEEVGIPRENIFVVENGQVIEFTEKGGRATDEKIDSSYVMVDGLGVGDVSDVVLRDRQLLSEDGIFIIVAQVDKKTGALVEAPDIISRGFVMMKENRELIEKSRARIVKLLKDREPRMGAFEDDLRNKLRDDIGQYLFHETKRRPMIVPVIIEV
jgi:ribonuclease J